MTAITVVAPNEVRRRVKRIETKTIFFFFGISRVSNPVQTGCEMLLKTEKFSCEILTCVNYAITVSSRLSLALDRLNFIVDRESRNVFVCE